MKQKYRNLITFAILILAVWYVSVNRQAFSTLEALGAGDIAIISAVLLVFFAATGLTFSLLVNLVETRLSSLEIVALSFLTNMVNYLAPLRPGAAVKAMYLKSVKGLEYSRFSSVFAANAFLVLATTSAAALIILGLNWYYHNLLPWELLAVSLALFLLSLAPFIVPSFSWMKLRGRGRVADAIDKAIDGFEQIRGQKAGVMLVCTSVVFQFLVSGLLMMLVYASIDIDLPYRMALLLGIFTSLANLFTVTPNNVGVQEAVMGYLVVIKGGDFNQGLVGAAILRAIHLALTFSVGLLLVNRMLLKADLNFREMMTG